MERRNYCSNRPVTPCSGPAAGMEKGRDPVGPRPSKTSLLFYSCSLWKRGTSISLALWAASRLFSSTALKNSTSS